MRFSAIVLLIVFSLIFIPGLVLGIIGSIFYPSEKYDLENSINTSCDVFSMYEYSRTSRSSKGRSTTTYYIDFTLTWTNEATGETDTGYATYSSSSYSKRNEKARMARMTGEVECWYDTIEPGQVRVTQPSPTTYLILLIVGWTLFGIAMIVGSILVFVCGCILKCH